MDKTQPLAKKLPKSLLHHDHERIDNYYWMRDDERKNDEVLAHLNAENAHCDALMAPHQTLQSQLFEEMKGRIVKDDSSVPSKDGSYWYVSEVNGDEEYAKHYRASQEDLSDKTLLLDVNQLAQGNEFYDVGDITVSPHEQLLAYSEDTDGRRIYTIKFLDLTTNTLLPDVLHNTEGQVVWANDNKTLFYVRKDEQTLLGFQVYRHVLGTPQSDDILVFEEQDRQFYMGLGKSRDDSAIFIYLAATETSDQLILDANDPMGEFKTLLPRVEGHEYGLEKMGEFYYILTNKAAKNFRLMRATEQTIVDIEQWEEVVAHREHVLLEGLELFNSHFVLTEREQGQIRFVVHDYQGQSYHLSFDDACYYATIGSNPEPSATSVRIHYSSMTTPSSVYDCNLTSGKKTLKKQQQVLGDFKPEYYHSERLHITARDGVKVPVSLVYRKDKFQQDGSNPLLQYGYGSYGITIDPNFSSQILSLLDRGFVYAIAHIRGSEMLGRQWYEQGKKAHKQNTFNDFIDVTKALVEQGYGDKDKVFASGGSAGGLLMGAIANQAPELYLGLGCHVPFLDVLTTMLDESIPLTTNEYDEWGNPNFQADYQTILAYSPYDNIEAKAYPHILVTTGLHDSQVQYWEPMKWVAKLREYKTDGNLLLFKTDMEAGHGGASGRFKSLHERALEMAFFISLLDTHSQA
ncbi:S9 family peptidase [Pseudoalteromonas sp. McH1-7]|uniref:S9 family peptidase n=1 Tax=unclassified Pseudoalteromonas TaxID=194690 RepID=UPI001591DE02|nr:MULTISPECIES: S9 family peptidase [unclassified Pseudoalteromonas]NUZ12335.1 S9 family peptidase [Pseudoalteromonas sp. McH1-7]USD28389.1 S9 family peptidase [Pseudoalteromonas sp. SCSIO 43201]